MPARDQDPQARGAFVAAAETLVRLVLAAVPPSARDVIDLYAGVGLFALPACTCVRAELARYGCTCPASDPSDDEVTAPLTAAVVWALYASPNTAIDVAAPLKVAIQLVVFAVAAGALAHTGKPRLAATFAALAVANTALIAIWGQ